MQLHAQNEFDFQKLHCYLCQQKYFFCESTGPTYSEDPIPTNIQRNGQNSVLLYMEMDISFCCTVVDHSPVRTVSPHLWYCSFKMNLLFITSSRYSFEGLLALLPIICQKISLVSSRGNGQST